ncbi:phage tail length tape measure family protein [Pseudoxanthomonas sp. LjRoot143]|uniref:phage tail length tape measure family protein n=1 Tax=Pseudoxanthomonas sp. LjRoot143 TaxID=3342266 RepID=UPI003ECE6E53
MSQRTSRFQVQFDVGGDGEVRASLKSLREEVKATTVAVEDSGEEWEEFGAKIGTAIKYAGATAVAGIGLIIRNTVAAEQEMAQLEAVLRSTGQGATYTRDQLVDMSEAIAAASTFSAGEIVKAETRLLSYSGIASKNFPEALQVAIDQAARLGMGVEQSAETIGRALESPQKAAAALAQQGFGAAFTDSVRKAIKELDEAGRTAEAQQIILDILTDSYGGAAQAARDTFGGSMIALKNTLADLLTGDTGGEGLEGVRSSVEGLITTLNSGDVRSGFANMTEGALGLVAGLASLVGWLDNAFGAAQRLLTIQGGGFSKLMGGENLGNQRAELAMVERELARRQSADAAMKEGRLTGDWLTQRASIVTRLPARLVGFEGIGGGTDKELRNRQAALQAQIEFNERIFGDPSRTRVNFSDQGDIPASMLRPSDGGGGRAPTGGGDGKKPRAAQLTEAEKATKQLNAEYDRMLERLQQEIALNGQTSELARVNYQIKQDGLDALNPQLAEQLRLAAEQIDAQERANELADEGKRLTEEMRTPQEVLNAQLARYRELLDAGTIDQTVYDRAAADATAARDAAEDAAKRAAQTFRTTDDVLSDFSSRTQDVLGNDLYDAFSGNADRIQERWKQMLLALAAELIASKVMEYFQSSGQGGGTASGEGAGFWGTVASFFGSFFGGGMATGGKMQRGKLYEIAEHGKPELVEQNGRRFLVAGAGGDVIPAQYAAAGGAGGASMPSIQFNVTNNHAGAEVSEPAFTWKEGKLLVDMAVNKVNQGLAQKGSPTHKSMMSGLSQGTRYG